MTQPVIHSEYDNYFLTIFFVKAAKYCFFHRDPADEWGSDSDSDETDTHAAAAGAKKVQYYYC